MTRTLQICRSSVVLLVMLLALPLGQAFGAAADTYVRIENRWKTDQQIHLETDALAASPTQPGWWSADWTFEPVGDGYHVRIKNRYRETYIHNQNGRLEAGRPPADAQGAMWDPEPADGGFYRLKNRRTGDYLNVQDGSLQLGKVMPGWQSAMWKLQGYTPTDKPVNQYTYMGAHNSVVSYDYGFAFQNSQRYDITTQLNGGVRALEVDIVYDTPDDRFAAGYYICHCGSAPHSYSASELKRAKGKMSEVPLPVWTAGPRYIRLNTILKSIDKWLVANPYEIVIVELQNNSGTAQQFDAEVALANLKTGYYKKSSPNTEAWPTRRELIRKNQRLIILAGDNSLSSSKYANDRFYFYHKGSISPRIYGNENIYRLTADDAKPSDTTFLIMNSFRTAETDAITAKYYNDYKELSQKKAEWAAKGHARFPTVIQFNQVQIGDALRFINEMNGPDYQVVGKVPSDPAGNWIVNASADIGTAFVQAAKSVQTFVEGEKTPEGQRAIKFNNQAGYVAGMSVTYFVNEKVGGVTLPIFKALSTPKISLGFTRPLVIPKDTAPNMPITVIIEGVGTIKNPVFSTTVPAGFTGELCFKAWNTIFDAQGGACT